jgi:hypothetical protein
MIPSITISSSQQGFAYGNLRSTGTPTSKPSGPSSGSSGSSASSTSSTSSTNSTPGQTDPLTPQELQQIQQLKQIDRTVRAHEQAHLSVGADLVRGGPSFSYQTGPDNQRYAVGGEVSIDTSPARTPEDTIPKAQHIRAAALAPAEPSPQDQSVAAQASRMEGEARAELAAQQRAVNEDQGSTGFYRDVERSDGEKSQIGARLDFFA